MEGQTTRRIETMLNLDQLKAAINNGELEKAYKDCRRYGVITSKEDRQWFGYIITTVWISYLGRPFKFSLRLGVATAATLY